jgi:hypothetical protein
MSQQFKITAGIANLIAKTGHRICQSCSGKGQALYSGSTSYNGSIDYSGDGDYYGTCDNCNGLGYTHERWYASNNEETKILNLTDKEIEVLMVALQNTHSPSINEIKDKLKNLQDNY